MTNYINGIAGGNFNSFNAANNAMKFCGVTGSVTFNVVPLTGPYLEQLKIDSIAGVNANNQIYFKGNGNTIAFATATTPTTTERAVIKLTKADFISFDSLIIDASAGTSYGYGLQLINNADSNSFSKCKILVNTSNSISNLAGVVINATDIGTTTLGSTLCDGNLFTNNTIIGGYYGITIVGSSTNFIVSNIIKNNIITDFYYCGIFVAGTKGTLIQNNILTRPNRIGGTSVYPIYCLNANSVN